MDASRALRQAAGNVPVVLLNPEVQLPGCDTLSIGNFQGAYAVVRHLIDLGHGPIATITGPTQNIDARQRLDGYRTALRDAGVEPDPALEFHGDFTERSGYEAAREMLRQQGRPTAVFVANDHMAVGVLGALQEAGRAVPDDVALAGFDDIPMARYLTPALTTVHVDMFQMGERAVEMLRGPGALRVWRGRAGTRCSRRGWWCAARAGRATRAARWRTAAAPRPRCPGSDRHAAPLAHRDGPAGVPLACAALLALAFAGLLAPACRGPVPAPDRLAGGARAATPRALTATETAFLDTLEHAHLPLVLGARRDARTGLTPDRAPTPSFASVGGDGLRADRLPDRRRARLGDAATQARERTLTTLRFFWQAPQGTRAGGLRPATAASSTTSSSPATGAPLRATSSSPPWTRRCCWPARCSASRTSTGADAARGRDPRPRRVALRARRLALGLRCGRRRSSHGWDPESGLPALRLARLQRGHAAATSWRWARRRTRSGRRSWSGWTRRLPLGHLPGPASTSASRRSSATSTRTSGSTCAGSQDA